MARTFGKLSYAPDRFLWDELNSKICKNILLEAYRNPSTIPFLRGMVVEGLLEQGFLKPEEEVSKLKGVFMVVD